MQFVTGVPLRRFKLNLPTRQTRYRSLGLGFTLLELMIVITIILIESK
jgi:prepilin-type N-terminal cleavage/methylation domain-containing protein